MVDKLYSSFHKEELLRLDEETAARSMGHSLTVREIYKAWIGSQVYRQKFEELLQRLS